jgi:hypothetical protein
MIVFSFSSSSSYFFLLCFGLVKIKNDERDVKSAYMYIYIYIHIYTLSRSFIHIIICLAVRLKEMVVTKTKKNLSFFLSCRYCGLFEHSLEIGQSRRQTPTTTTYYNYNRQVNVELNNSERKRAKCLQGATWRMLWTKLIWCRLVLMFSHMYSCC